MAVSTSAPPPSMHINSLSDVLLRRILASLPLADILRLDHVCRRWTRLQSEICRQVRSVTILVGDVALKEMQASRFGIPHLELLQDVSQHRKASDINPEVNQLQFDWLDLHSAGTIARHLPNVTSLQISMATIPYIQHYGEKSWRRRTFAFDSLIFLINAWLAQLQTLKVYSFFIYQPTNNIDETLQRLFDSANRCTALRHFTFESGTNYYFKSQEKPPLDFQFLAWIEELSFYFYDYSAEICESLGKYALANDNLHSLSLASIDSADLEKDFFRSAQHTKLYRTFRQLPSIQVVDFEEDLKALVRFPSIEKLTINIFTLTEFYENIHLLARLEKLLFLEMCFHNNPDEELPADWQGDPPEACLLQLPSIRILRIFAMLHSHSDLYRIKWAMLFPNVEVIEFDNGKMICETCRMDDEDVGNGQAINERGNFLDFIDRDMQRQYECSRLALQAWKQCSRLHTIYTGFTSELKLWFREELRWDPV